MISVAVSLLLSTCLLLYLTTALNTSHDDSLYAGSCLWHYLLSGSTDLNEIRCNSMRTLLEQG
ncbi:hypothetical protein BDR03DRAFT_667675 [Suillus americanus]|nr:hypothetical protein BDR03DRAFT_667675 [Suillus americanus]